MLLNFTPLGFLKWSIENYLASGTLAMCRPNL